MREESSFRAIVFYLKHQFRLCCQSEKSNYLHRVDIFAKSFDHYHCNSESINHIFVNCLVFFSLIPSIFIFKMIRSVFIVIVCTALVAESSYLAINRSSKKAESCGVPTSSMGLIVRGQSFPRGSFPWIVALLHTDFSPPRFFCGGTLISKSFVISGMYFNVC